MSEIQTDYQCKCGNYLKEKEIGILSCTCGREYYEHRGKLRSLDVVREDAFKLDNNN